MEKRRISRWWAVAAGFALLVACAAVLPSPYAIERPGPVVDALGTIETEDGEAPVIRIGGAETFATSGSLNVLSVSISGTPEHPVDWLSLAGSVFDPTRVVVPLATLYPDGVDGEARAEQTRAQMEASQLAATAAALRELGDPVVTELVVASVETDGPADGLLREGDTIRTANGAGVADLAGLRAAMGEGGAVFLGLERERADGEAETREVEIEPRVLSGEQDPRFGISVVTVYEFPFDVQLELSEIGGPSAGLVFALAVYDTLTEGGLTGGLSVSGTGTIGDDGGVGAIGGLPQKLWGAARAGSDLVLIPVENCADLPERLPDGLVVAPVATLGEAIDAIGVAADGGVPAGVERCPAG